MSHSASFESCDKDAPSKLGTKHLEICDNFDGDTYRTVYTTRLEGVLYVLHAFQKKSTSGIATPQRHIDLVRQRLRDAEAIHKATKGDR
ncbi:type II toxin-antitoxin system RelE/ParE family toxin [Bradyrhizobium pachyrhizi]|uniref:type II toxin-antitoxin system RelE/ParE family toxin n=1 Tax=Bradyrhizobium pachyrhizi TaxID=280333 RepID=UPI003D36B6C0